MKGNIYWFDRNVNFFVPKAPVEGAVVTYQLSRERSRAGVRTMLTGTLWAANPGGWVLGVGGWRLGVREDRGLRTED